MQQTGKEAGTLGHSGEFCLERRKYSSSSDHLDEPVGCT
jgi:hypothetical protein